MALADRKRWLVPAGYTALGIASFLYFLFLGFPFDRLLAQKTIAEKLDTFQRQNQVKVDVGSIRGGWFFDLVAKNVKITPSNPMRAASPDATPDDPVLQIDSIAVRPAPLALLSGRLGLHVDAALYGGHVSGTIGVGRSSTAVDLGVRNVEIAKYPMLANKFQLNVAGQANGSVDVVLDTADGTKSKGKIDLALKNAVVNESNPYGIQKIPRTAFDKGAGAVAEIHDGKVDFKDVGLHGDDLDVSLEGMIELKKILAFSTWDARATIKPSETFKSQVSLLDTFLGPGRSGDSYRYRLQGTINRMPRASPDRGGPGGR